MDWEKYGFVNASNYRKNVVRSLSKKPKMPKEIAKENDYYLSHVSNTLKELQEKNIVECLTKEREKGKIYALTEEGKKIFEKIEE